MQISPLPSVNMLVKDVSDGGERKYCDGHIMTQMNNLNLSPKQQHSNAG